MAKTFKRIIILYLLMPLVGGYLVAQDSSVIKRHLEYLGSDLFGGRGTGSIGGELSAKYIALNLNKYELIPMGYENTFYQYIPMHGSKPSDDSKITIVGKKNETLQIKKNFQYYHTGGRIFAPNPISMIFVGYGISAPEFEYDDYANIEVEGKVVLFIEGEPNSDNSKYFNGKFPTNYSFADTKQKIALSKGAVGTIQIPAITCKSDQDWEKIIQEYYFEDISLAYLPTPLLSILLNPKAAPLLFSNSKYSFYKIIEMYKNQKFISFELSSKLLLEPKFVRRDFVAPNVVGYVEGSDKELRNEYVVVTAHYDHLGIGLPVEGDSIYNGVLDNAIGVSAMLELSKLFSNSSSMLKRSIIFLFTTGEEKGLLGSSYFIEHPPVLKSKIVANINIDGLAVIDMFYSVVGVGAKYSSLNKILNDVATINNLRVDEIPMEFDSYESFMRSDQLAFALAGIPSILISDGIDYLNLNREEALQKWKEYINYKYHTPFDDLNQAINYSAVDQHLKFLFDFILEVANSEYKIEWNNNAPFKRREE